MIKYAVKYLKNTFHPLGLNIKDGLIGDGDIKEDIDSKLVLVRTEKGEEVLKAFLVNKEIASLFELKKKKLLHFLNVRNWFRNIIW